MRLCVVDPGCITPAYDSELCRALAESGHQVTLVTAPYRNDQTFHFPKLLDVRILFFAGIGLMRFPGLRRVVKGITYAYYFWRFLKFAEKQAFEVFHFQWLLVPPIDLLFISKLKAVFPGIPIVITVHDVQPHVKPVGGGGYLRKILSMVDGVVVHGVSAKEELLRSMPELSPAKVDVIPHGPLHRDSGTGTEMSVSESRDLLGIDRNSHLGLFFGEFKEHKGLDTLRDALGGLSRDLRDRLCFLVAGKVEDSGCEAQLTALEQLPLSIRVDRGYVPTEQVPIYFRAADFVVLPYRLMTQSGVLLTAIANGCPVIVSDVGEMPNLVNQVHGGRVVPAEDSLALKEALQEFLGTERSVLARDGERARYLLDQHFNWEIIAAKTLDSYQRGSILKEGNREVRAG